MCCKPYLGINFVNMTLLMGAGLSVENGLDDVFININFILIQRAVVTLQFE